MTVYSVFFITVLKVPSSLTLLSDQRILYSCVNIVHRIPVYYLLERGCIYGIFLQTNKFILFWESKPKTAFVLQYVEAAVATSLPFTNFTQPFHLHSHKLIMSYTELFIELTT